MKTGAIIQARMGSTRLPGKVLREVNEKPLLLHMIERISRSRLLDSIIIATSSLTKDDIIEKFCFKNDILLFRGSEENVLERYYECAKNNELDVIVRLTADCPLIDPNIIDACIEGFNKDTHVGYFSNTCPIEKSKYPNGSDVEVFSFNVLEESYKFEKSDKSREHVTSFMPENFNSKILSSKNNWSSYRYTVDYPEDFEVVDFLIKEIKNQSIFGTTEEIISIIDSNPEIRKKNKHLI